MLGLNFFLCFPEIKAAWINHICLSLLLIANLSRIFFIENLGLHFILVFIPDVNVPCKEFDNGTSLHIAASNLCLEGAKCLVSLADLLLGNKTGQFKENHPSQKNYLLVFRTKTLFLIFNLTEVL